ncbi:hypothetical protein HUJ04_010013 [Dendroctonus ponderosae]|nr:hypothetical protein HUJ04_010013 [Dendroctonus ponderosae]
MAVDEKLQKHYSYFDQFLRRSKREFEAKLHQDIKQNCALDDFDLTKTLGAGSFGMVVLCRDKRDKNIYALKLMEKSNIIKTRQLVHTGAEIKLMKNLKFPFFIDMHGFFMDNVYVGICMSFANGGDMFTHLREQKKFDESMSKFYGAQVILAFEYLHHLGVIYRDLKPENILLDLQGYLRVTDLGFCKKIDNTRTYTLCGTPEYLAPEIILSQGYNKSVDYWSYGVLLFEMNAGYAPFYAKDPMRLYGLLKNGVKDIKGHDWFKNTDFDQLLSKKLVPSYIPKVEDETDTKYFEPVAESLVVKKRPVDEFAKEFDEIFITAP